MPVTQLPFRAFIPDGSRYGQELDRFENVLPINMGARALQQKQAVASVADGPMLGAYVHIFQQSVAEQVLRPDGVAEGDNPLWFPNSGSTVWTPLNEEIPSDGDFIYMKGGLSTVGARMTASNVATPAAGTQTLSLRYRVVNYSAPTVSVTSITRSGATATVTTATSHGLSNGDYAVIAGANQTEYNGVFKITFIDSGSFSYTVSGTPATPATGTITMKRAWWLRTAVEEGPGTIRLTDEAAGGADVTTFTHRSTTHTPTVTDWSNLFFTFIGTVPGDPTYIRPISDDSVVGTWTTHSGGTSNLFATIDEVAADDADYVVGPPLAPGQTASFTVNLASSTQLWWNDQTTHAPHYRYFALNSGTTLQVYLLQGSTVLDAWTHANLTAGVWTTVTSSQLSQNTINTLKVTGYTNLKLRFVEIYPSSVASTQTQFARPTSDVSVGVWENELATQVNVFASIDESSLGTSDFATAVSLPLAGDPALPYTFALGAVSDPIEHAGHIFDVWVTAAGFGTHAGRLELLEGSDVRASLDFLVTAGGGTQQKTLTLSAAEAATINDYANLRGRITLLPDTTNWSLTLYMAQLSVPQPRRLRISWAELQLPTDARIEVSWVEYRTPATDTTYRGDIVTRFCGSRNKLYTFDPSAFTDRSKAGSPAYGSAVPGGWHFCSWGNHVIATNFVDAVQWRQNNTGNFADLITSTEKPKARFCCPARGMLLLGGINLTNHENDEVWWSALENIPDFHPAATTTQCDFQRLVATPGQLTGLVGGNDPFVFKRGSLYRLFWVDGDLVWEPQLISDSVGTPYSRSIVAGQATIYFWGGETFYRLPTAPGATPQPFAGPVLSRYLTDTHFSEGAIKQVSPAGMKEEDQVMIGAWDRHAGLIAWAYQGKNDSEWKHSRAVVYNPIEDRWSVWNLPAANLAALFSLPNTINDDQHILKGLLGIDWDGANSKWLRFDGESTYSITLRTKIFPIAMEQEGRPRKVRLKGVLPVFTADTLTGEIWPDVTVTVTSSIDLRFETGSYSAAYTASAAADPRQWLPFDQEGYWFQITLDVPTMRRKILRTLDALYLDWELR